MQTRGCVRVYDTVFFFFFSSRRRHTRCSRDWSSDVCSSDLISDRGETLTRQLSGTLATETCKQNAHLALRLPISFTIRDTDLTAVSIALPKTLHVVPAPQTPPWARRQDIPVDAFARLTFSLRTDAPEQPD